LGEDELNSKEDVSFLPARQQAGGTVKDRWSFDDSSVQGHAADISDTCRPHGALALKSTIQLELYWSKSNEVYPIAH
jgi:hypothetical protein